MHVAAMEMHDVAHQNMDEDSIVQESPNICHFYAQRLICVESPRPALLFVLAVRPPQLFTPRGSKTTNDIFTKTKGIVRDMTKCSSKASRMYVNIFEAGLVAEGRFGPVWSVSGEKLVYNGF